MQLESSIQRGEEGPARGRQKPGSGLGPAAKDESYDDRKGALGGMGQHRGPAGRNSQHLRMQSLSLVLVGGTWLLGCGARPVGLHGSTGLQ